MVTIIHFVPRVFSHVSFFYSRGWQCAQQLVLSYTKELRKSQLRFWKEEVWTQETTWCYCILQVHKYLIHTCGVFFVTHLVLLQSFKISGLFVLSVCRRGPDSCLLWLPLCWGYPGHSETTTPTEFGGYSPHSPHDHWCECIKIEEILFWNIWTFTIPCLICRWVKQPASSPLSLSWGSSGPGRLLPASISRPGPLSLIQVPEPL